MTAPVLYTIIAFLTIVVVALLLRPALADRPPETRYEPFSPEGLWDAPGLILAERILDPTDYLWLRDELGFPDLADSLRRNRRMLVLKWLSAVRASFREMVLTPEPIPGGRTNGGTQDSWQLLRMTLRFHLFLTYAFAVVKLFGPYHRLIPSLGWLESPWRPLPSPEIEHEGTVKRSI